MNKTEHLLSCLAEEGSEVAHRISKALRFGLEEVQAGQKLTNAERIAYETADFLAVVEVLVHSNLIPNPFTMFDEISAKKEKVEKYLSYAREVGAVVNEQFPATMVPEVCRLVKALEDGRDYEQELSNLRRKIIEVTRERGNKEE